MRPLLLCLIAATGAALAQSIPVADDQQRLDRALAAIAADRPGTVDAFVVVASLDRDPVFDREAREAGRVLARRFGAVDRTVVLAGDEGTDGGYAPGTPATLAATLARVAARMNRKEDVLVLYTTSHGTPRVGLNFEDAVRGKKDIAPGELAAMLAGFDKRLVVIQACFSGQFIPALKSSGTVVATAASAMTSSFGCAADNDWTFFGHALINQAMRQPDTFVRQFRRAYVSIIGWEKRLGVPSSNPQIDIGSETTSWLAALDTHAPASAGPSVGRPPNELQ
jgi:hypothetical protein